MLLFVPMYNCAPQIARTLAQVTPALQQRFREVLVLDNGSTDGGTDRALEMASRFAHTRLVVGRNDANYNLGGSHKVAFQRALDTGATGVVVFHGDDQGHLADLMDVLGDAPSEECVLGARFMRGSRLLGYSPHRIAGNVVLNGMFSAVTGAPLWDLGSGLNYYARRFLERGLWRTCRDDLTFNYDLLLRTCAVGCAVRFVPISWREEDQLSNARLWRHGKVTLRTLARYWRSPTDFVSSRRSAFDGPRTFTVLS